MRLLFAAQVSRFFGADASGSIDSELSESSDPELGSTTLCRTAQRETTFLPGPPLDKPDRTPPQRVAETAGV